MTTSPDTSDNHEETLPTQPSEPVTDLGDWGLEVTVAGHTAKFSDTASLALWIVARAGELQAGNTDAVSGATNALVAELTDRAVAGDERPFALLAELCTERVARAASSLSPEVLLSRTWEQLSAGAPAGLTEALPRFLSIVEDVVDGTASGSVTLDVRETVMCAVAVWAGLLADPASSGWDELLDAAEAGEDRRLTSLDGEISLRLAV